MMKLILASASPRRAELLEQIGVEFEVKAVGIDETPQEGEDPCHYVRRLAIEKASTARTFYSSKNVLVLGSDTSVVIDDHILGKPIDKAHAFEMLTQLSGRTHTVMTSVAVLGAQALCLVNESKVTFAVLSEHELEWYWTTGEPKGKAGAYGIQGKAAKFITQLDGSFSGVMGLPLYETAQLLQQQGFISR